MGRSRFVGKGSNQGLCVDMFSLRCLLFIRVETPGRQLDLGVLE